MPKAILCFLIFLSLSACTDPKGRCPYYGDCGDTGTAHGEGGNNVWGKPMGGND